MASQHKIYFLSCFIAASLLANIATAQTQPIVHTIKQGETLSALAKKYSTTVGDIMRLNGMNSNSKLQIGEAVKIPTTATNIAETPKSEPAKPQSAITKQPEISATVTDVTYKVLKGQSLYGIAKQFKTTEKQIIAWNNLPNDKIRAGQTIIVGKKVLEKSTIPVTPKPQLSKPGEDKPVVAPPVTQQTTKSEELTVLNAGSAKVTTPAETKPIPAPVKEAIKTEPAAIPASAKYVESEGFFANYFNHKDRNLTTAAGDASIFKTTSGWTDKKYYVLMNDVNQGDIVRLTANNKTICAKVLGPLPDIKEDSGLLLRVSNAAAAVLGIEDAKFNVTVSY
ncbi:LysM peptidoglycan-binding domain-containing protein [Parasediminibacterium paludis]|uniref:LysM peptidoglycan-binding domain-containing protein n=1 Tax=Parasediminibacterium paludis TaxID=908966 RepID=A0ABV8PV08_9BACT